MSASQENKRTSEVLHIQSRTAPPYFGLHPSWLRSFYSSAIRFAKGQSKTVPLKKFYDPIHPAVYVIPSHKFLCVVDKHNEKIAPTHFLWFSSTSFYIDDEKRGSVFQALDNRFFCRLANIGQLGYLTIPYKPRGFKIFYVSPPFTHKRFDHSLFSALMAEVILARNGFTPKQRAPIVLTIACHDIATPAGGEPVKRIDPKKLDEEVNFAFILERSGLAEKWAKLFHFDLKKASSWVKNQGVMGLLLDVLDKISYVSLDCYHLGCMFNGKVRQYCLNNPLFINVWEDIRFTPDKKRFAFVSSERLFVFLLARAYEHQELLLNPEARRLDFYLTRLVKPLYERGLITKEQLLTWGNDQLESKLGEYYQEEEIKNRLFSPDDYEWKVFKTEDEQKEFCQKVGGDRLEHTEKISEFNPCLDWPVFVGKNKIVPLKDCLSRKKIDLLKDIVKSVKGYYVYYLK